jgi:hypothetical protein
MIHLLVTVEDPHKVIYFIAYLAQLLSFQCLAYLLPTWIPHQSFSVSHSHGYSAVTILNKLSSLRVIRNVF